MSCTARAARLASIPEEDRPLSGIERSARHKQRQTQKTVRPELSVAVYVLTKYETADRELVRYLMKNDENIRTYKDFAFFLALYTSRDEPNMNVLKSSTWAVCQEFLGNLSGDYLDYSQSRGGSWSFTDGENVSVRQVLTDLRETYPSI